MNELFSVVNSNLDLVILFIAFSLNFIVIFYLKSKLTPNNPPENIAGVISSAIKFVIILIISVYLALLLLQLFL